MLEAKSDCQPSIAAFIKRQSDFIGLAVRVVGASDSALRPSRGARELAISYDYPSARLIPPASSFPRGVIASGTYPGMQRPHDCKCVGNDLRGRIVGRGPVGEQTHSLRRAAC